MLKISFDDYFLAFRLPPREITAAETRINRFHPAKSWSLHPAIIKASVGTTNPAQFPPEFTIDFPQGCLLPVLSNALYWLGSA